MEINTNKYIQPDSKAPKHEVAAAANEVVKLLGNNKQYPYTYWLRKVKGISYSKVLSICKEASNLPNQYSKGGFLTNRFKEISK